MKLFLKPIILTLLFVGMSFIGIAAARTKVPPMVKFKNEKEGFALKIPAGWKINPGQDEIGPNFYGANCFMARRPIQADDEYQDEDALPGQPCSYTREEIGVVTETLSSSFSLNDYFKNKLELLKEGFSQTPGYKSASYKVLKIGALLRNGSLRVKYVVFTYRPGDCGGGITDILFLYVKGTKGYSLFGESYPERFDRYKGIFFAVADSFDPGK